MGTAECTSSLFSTTDMQASAIPAFGRAERAQRKSQRIWVACLLIVYAYLYACICLGAPFSAFDHENYINFLNNPTPFFFEPVYTSVAYLVNWTFPDDQRFPAVFIVFTLPPLLMVLRHARRPDANAGGIAAFACVVTKSFYIGFIAQRFFFSELWVAAILITAAPRPPKLPAQLLSGLIHFSALTVMPTILWLRSRFSGQKCAMAFIAMFGAYAYVRLFSGFNFFGYSYARYLDSDDAVSGFPLMSFLQMLTLAVLAGSVAARHHRANLIALCGLIFMIKLIFGDIEVFSRVIQLQTDLVLVVATLSLGRPSVRLFAYAMGFLVLQVFFTPTSAEMAVHHTLAILNAWQSF